MKGLLRAVFLFALAFFASPLDAQEDFPLPPPQITSAVGIRAPEFRLPDQLSQIVSLASFRGSKVLLMFYRGYW